MQIANVTFLYRGQSAKMSEGTGFWRQERQLVLFIEARQEGLSLQLQREGDTWIGVKLITISNGGTTDDHDNNDDSTPLHNVLFVQFGFLTTEQAETHDF